MSAMERPHTADGPAPTAIVAALADRFPDRTTVDERGALIVDPGGLLAVAEHARCEHHLDYLANLTAVDWPDRLQVIYHVCSTSGGAPITLKVDTDRSAPSVPSVRAVWPAAEFQEREVYDLFGVHFEGHPDLRRILLWEGFGGHPLRKDWTEPYFEAQHKPFASRWPAGSFFFAEERLSPWGGNYRYPEGYAPETAVAECPPPAAADVGRELAGPGEFARGEPTAGSQRLAINMGPQHPSTHGVFQMQLVLEGETVVGLKPVMGYMHRNHEKIGERNLWLMNMAYTDRLDYVSQMGNEWGYALCVERLLGASVPERAEYIRIIMAELNRIQSHFWSTGFLLNDLGAFFTPSLYAIEEREMVLDLFEMASGSRMMCNYMRFGGVAHDLPEPFLPLARSLVYDRLPRAIDQIDNFLTGNEVVEGRLRGVGVLPPDKAIAYGTSGPVIRGSGVPYDIRRADPYGFYDRFEWDVVTRPEGDCFARYMVRIGEMRQSLRILRQALEQLPGGEVFSGRKTPLLKVPAGECYARVENPRGELGYYCVSDGGPNPYRYRIRSPCFVNLTCLEELCRGHKVADVVAILGSIDIVLGEVDR